MMRAGRAAAFFLALVGIWQLAVMSGRWSPVLLPPPDAVADYLQAALGDGSLVDAAGVTLRRLLTGRPQLGFERRAVEAGKRQRHVLAQHRRGALQHSHATLGHHARRVDEVDARRFEQRRHAL